MSNRTRSYNGWNSLLAGTLASGNTTVPVDSAAGLVAPLYLVVDWDDPAKIEWIKIGTVVTNTLSNITRNLSGSVGDVTHDVGAKIRAVTTKQLIDDIFTDIEAIEGAGYVNGTYVDAGDSASVATAQAYSDGLDHDHAGPIGTHAGLTDVHHNEVHNVDSHSDVTISAVATGEVLVKSAGDWINQTYAEADIAAKTYVDGLDHDVSGAVSTHDGAVASHGAKANSNPHNHDRYIDNEALSAMGVLGIGNPLNHNRYTDAEVSDRILTDDDYVKNTGDTMTGVLLAPGGSAAAPGVAVGIAGTGLFSTVGGFVGLSENGTAIISGNGDTDLNLAGVVGGTGDDMRIAVGGGSQVFRVVSSRRYKDVGPVVDKAALREKLMALPVYEWNYKTEPDIMHIGWMAEDVATVDPRLVNFDAEGRPDSLRTLDILAIVG